MSAQQALAKGTHVEITDPDHPWIGDRAEIVSAWDDGLLRIRIPASGFAYAALRPDQFRVIEQPEPTIGQLVDAMHQEIERTCERMGWTLLAVDLQSDFNPSKHQTSIQILGRGWIDCTGDTPQAALRAMIERLQGLEGGAGA